MLQHSAVLGAWLNTDPSLSPASKAYPITLCNDIRLGLGQMQSRTFSYTSDVC